MPKKKIDKKKISKKMVLAIKMIKSENNVFKFEEKILEEEEAINFLSNKN